MNMHPMRPARKPNEPRKISLKTPSRPHLVIKDINHPLSAPIAIPAMAYRTKPKITTIKGVGNTGI
jgi:hypothetical protein